MQRNAQIQKQSQKLKILPQQIQFLNLLQLNAVEMENYINKELEENPYLEQAAPAESENVASDLENRTEESEIDYDNQDNWGNLDDDIPDYNTRTENGYQNETPRELRAVSTDSWRKATKRQIRLEEDIEPEKLLLVEYIIDSLEENGMLQQSLQDLTDNYSFGIGRMLPIEEMEEALTFIQDLDPPGIGARDLRECLLIQIDRLRIANHDLETVEVARGIIDNHLENLASRNFDRIKLALDVDTEEIRAAIELITSLNPHPITISPEETLEDNSRIIPDYQIEVDGSEIIISLVNSRAGSVRLGSEADELSKRKLDKKASNFLKMKIEDARWLEEALRQRDNTMLNTMKIIASIQREFFYTGDKNDLKPMVLKDVADKLDMDVSTISRVTSRKYAQTPYGVMHVKDFFVQTITTNDGEVTTTKEIMNVLAEIIENEDKSTPYNDSQLMKQLAEKGHKIARRTVAKYRENLGIPVANRRRELI